MFAPWVEQAGRAYQMPQLTVTGHHHHHHHLHHHHRRRRHHHHGVGYDQIKSNESIPSFWDLCSCWSCPRCLASRDPGQVNNH